MREVADVHRGLFAEHADDYGENVRTKVERCLAVTASEVETRRAREDYREVPNEALGEADRLLAPDSRSSPRPRTSSSSRSA